MYQKPMGGPVKRGGGRRKEKDHFNSNAVQCIKNDEKRGLPQLDICSSHPGGAKPASYSVF